MPHRTTNLTEEDDKKIGELHLGGMRIAALARLYNVFPSSIRTALKFQGISPQNNKFGANEDAFTNFHNELDCYWLGFIYADGSASKKNGFQIRLKSSDEKHLQKLHKYLKLENKLFKGGSFAKSKYHENIYLRCSNRDLVKKLMGLGIVPGRPSPLLSIENIPNHMLHHFFRGLFDGDGCAHKIPKITFLCQAELLEALRKELIFKALVSENPTVRRNGGIFRIDYGGFQQCSKIKKYLYRDASIFLERKLDIINSWTRQTRTLLGW